MEQTAEFLIELVREVRERARRQGLGDHYSDPAVMELYSFDCNRVVVLRVVDERAALVEIEVARLIGLGLSPDVVWSESLDGGHFLRCHEDPAAAYLDELNNLLATATRQL